MFNAQRTRLTGRPAGTTNDLQRLGVNPSLIGPDFRANPQFLTWNTTPGEFGQFLLLRDKNSFDWNISMTKSFGITERARLSVFGSLNNVLNHPRWTYGDTTGLPPTALNTFSTQFGVMDAGRIVCPTCGPTSVNGNRSINLRATLSF